MKASVVIPAKNGGELLIRVVEQVLAQRSDWPFEVLVIDSGSTDGSIDAIRKLPVTIHTIPSHEFGHGKTRNLGASLTRGEFIVFLTHDALPAHERWLAALIEAAELAPDTGGAFGPHLPYPDASPMLRRELTQHFKGFGDKPGVVRNEDPARYAREEGYRQFLHFFSSNNACLRRSVWERIPLRDVDFAEDQMWAKDMIEAGYAKAYAPEAEVFHSHNFGVAESLQRAFDESRALNRLFGYVLSPALSHVLANSMRLTRRDWQWVNEDVAEAGHRLLWRIRVPLLNLARLSGHYLGARHASLPDWLVETLSRDKRLFRS